MPIHCDTPVQYLKGVGPRVAQILSKKNIYTVEDLLNWYPRGYEDRRAARTLSSLSPGDRVSVIAEVFQVSYMNLGRSQRRIYNVRIKDASGYMSCKFFRIPFRGYFDRLQKGKRVRVIGKVTSYNGQIEFHHPDILDVNENDENKDEIVPLYTEIEGLSHQRILKILKIAFSLIEDIPDTLPETIIRKNNLPSRKEAITQIHFPKLSDADKIFEMKTSAYQRLIFEEFFWLELQLAKKRSQFTRKKGALIREDKRLFDRIQLEYRLTDAQNRTLYEIIKDITSGYPMLRLIQGDVGSGKTIVALLATSIVIQNGFQVALMAPTEILAEQHFKTARTLFKDLGVKVDQLVGSLNSKAKRERIAKLESGETNLIIGTHALIQEGVNFNNLGFVIVDEQHRFGVKQRGLLKLKGKSPHFLVMTATPIPRTLAMTVYGDLEVSVLNELPPGRIPALTRLVYSSSHEKMWNFLKREVESGRQAYVVYPLVEVSEKMDLKAAEMGYIELQKKFRTLKVGLLHGQMKSLEKDTIMKQFRDREIQILVSTSIIEVGVDVPNATIMVIEHAERFGLSQLHQLRGRVGRGSGKSYCFLLPGYALSEESRERLNIMTRTVDGFKIAEADLEIRGPGEFLGAKQSGLPGFRMAHLTRDIDILKKARKSAFEIITKDPGLKLPEHVKLQEKLEKNLDLFSNG